MTKERLEKMRALRSEIRLLEEAVNHLPVTQDSVKGSMSEFPYIEVTIPISGTDAGQGQRLKQKILQKIAKLQNELNELEEWLDKIHEPELRTILRLYYGQGMTQEEIGDKVGYSRETIQRKIKKYVNAM